MAFLKRLRPGGGPEPGLEKRSPSSELVCELCKKVCNGKRGLAGHMRLAHQAPVKADAFKAYVDESVKEASKAYAAAELKLFEDSKAALKELTFLVNSRLKLIEMAVGLRCYRCDVPLSGKEWIRELAVNFLGEVVFSPWLCHACAQKKGGADEVIDA